MYNNEEYNILASKYGSFASWAIWDYKNQSDASIIGENRGSLHSKFVLLALNFSQGLIKQTWGNFHYGPSNVRKIKFACDDNKLRGSYMTDLFKNMVEKNSAKVKNLLDEDLIKRNVDLFNQEMQDIKIDNDSTFVVWGVPSSELALYFNKYFKQDYKNPIIYHTHYSYYGISDREWVTSLWGKLNIHQDYEVTVEKFR
jgi:hypothetical protein